MEGSAGLRFGVLGPLAAWVDGQVVSLGGIKQRLVLAGLLVHANTVVSVDRLVDIVWGDTPPEDATSTLAKYVYRLRVALRAGSDGPLSRRSPGYLLSVTADQFDAMRFAALLHEAKQLLPDSPARSTVLLDEALGLWRGSAWGEFADLDFVQPELTRLEALHAVAVEDRAEAMLALGQYEQLIPELQAVAGKHPLRERPHAQLMLALYFTGRHAEALAVYRDFRRLLLDEVGLEPSVELRRLEEDILQQSVRPTHRLQPLPAVPSRAPGLDFTRDERMIGRSSDLAWLEVLFEHASAGEQPVVGVITGPSGIGKTNLVKAFGRRVQARGGTVVYARCDEVLGADGSLLEAFAWRSKATFQSSTHLDGASGLENALAAVGKGPLLVMLDDLDAVEEAWSLVTQLFSMRSAALCVVGTARDIDVDSLDSSTIPVHIRVLDGLSRNEVSNLLASLSGEIPPSAFVDSVYADTAGVPSLVTAIGQRLRDMDIANRVDDALAEAEAARQGLTDVRQRVTHSVLALRETHRPPTPVDRHSPICPYKGLAPFGVADVHYFCGRDQLVAQLVARLAVDRFVGVVGASGSGKSSLLAAGLVPALASAALPGSDTWPRVLIRPGADPISRLTTALAPLLNDPLPAIRERLRSDPMAIDELARRAVDYQQGRRLVVVVDQFEEIFTVCTDDEARNRFVQALVAGEAGPDNVLVVALAIRADYYGACAEYPELARLLAGSHVLVSGMTDREMRQAVLEPARRAGLTVEDGLPDAVCADAAGEPGALPLVSTALLETWVRRSGDWLTLAGYADAGGVRGAVARLADGVYEQLDPAGREIARHIFLRLADPHGATDDVRRRAHREEIAGNEAERQVLATLIDHRLVTASDDTVEVAHEALLREWPRLRRWLEDDREGRRLHRQVTDAALAWQADNRDEAGLFRGVRLQTARDWVAAHTGEANFIEAEFLAASEAAHERTLRTARRTARRLRWLAIGLAALLVLAITAGAIAVLQRSEARKQERLAHARALQAETSRLATLARTLPNSQRDLALLMGVQGYRIDPSDETAGGLQAALIQTPSTLDRVIRYDSATSQPHLNASGRLLAVAGSDGVTVHDLAHASGAKTLPWPQPREFAVFSGDDRRVAAGGIDGTIAIWDLATGKPTGPPLKVGTRYANALFDPTNSDRLYAFTGEGELTTWDLHDPRHPARIGETRYFVSTRSLGAPFATITPNGRRIAVGEPLKARVIVWDLATNRQLGEYLGDVGQFGADNVTLPVGDAGNDIQLFNVVTGEATAAVPSPNGTWPFSALSNDGSRIAVTLMDQGRSEVVVYDVRTRTRIGDPLQLHGNAAIPVGFLPDGRLVTTGSDEAAIWRVGRSTPILATPLPTLSGHSTHSVFMPRRDEVVTVDEENRELIRHDARTGRQLGPLLNGRVQADFAPSPDGAFVLAADMHSNAMGIWSLQTGDSVSALPGVAPTANVAWSPDGRLVASDYGPAVQLWDVTRPNHPKLRATVPRGSGATVPAELLFSPDRRWLITTTEADRRVAVIDIRTAALRWERTITEANLAQVAASPDGKEIVVVTGDKDKGRLTVYDSATGRRRQARDLPSFGGVGYVHGGQWLAATSGGGAPSAQLYNASTLTTIGIPFPLSGGTISGGTIGPVYTNTSGTRFSVTEIDKSDVWDTDPADWQTIACQIAGRNLTQAEWHQYLPSRPYQITCPGWPAGK
jgi:DNA-binding SARP family transcriptional activator/WD40 repeat protein